MLPTVSAQQSPVTFNKRVGANIQKFRKAAGMSQAELGRALGHRGFPMEQQTILTIERGSRPLKWEEGHVIAEVLGVDPESLTRPADERTEALEKLNTAEAAIDRCDRERRHHEQEVNRLTAEIAQLEQLRREAAQRLVAIFDAEGRPDLASHYANLESAEDWIASWRELHNG
jgi:transcriptional regulator with XRE-family HTH domain